jgi:hypothetical protein
MFQSWGTEDFLPMLEMGPDSPDFWEPKIKFLESATAALAPRLPPNDFWNTSQAPLQLAPTGLECTARALDFWDDPIPASDISLPISTRRSSSIEIISISRWTCTIPASSQRSFATN